MRRHPADYDVTYERDGKTYRLPESRMTFLCNRCGQHAFAKIHQPPAVWPVYLLATVAFVIVIALLLAVIP